MAHQEEFLEAKLLHHVHLVLGHDALGVIHVLRVSFDLGAVAVASQVRADNGEILGQTRCDLVPHGMGLGVPVEHQHGRPAAALHQVYRRPIGFYLKLFKSLKHSFFPFFF